MEDDNNFEKSNNWFWRIYEHIYGWVNRHINWSMFLGICISGSILTIFIPISVYFYNILCIVVFGFINAWGLSKKNRSLWFVLLTLAPPFFVIPIILKGKNGEEATEYNSRKTVQIARGIKVLREEKNAAVSDSAQITMANNKKE